jgi:hypothetical protein
MGDSLYFVTTHLLTGQQAPFTGAWELTARSRDFLYSFYTNGSGNITLQYQSPFFENDGINFYNINLAGSGYGDSSYSTSPVSHVRAICSGSGRFYCALTQQN